MSAVLDQMTWIRRLACRLTRRADLADDLTQETLLVALCSPPDPGRPLRPWLAGVLFNLVHEHWRTECRRGRRERSLVAADTTVATPEVLVERARQIGSVLALLFELAEPYRSTLLQRYGEGLSSADIARRHGLSASTVRSRVKHALDQLRGRASRRGAHDRSHRARCRAVGCD